jgi:fatty-acyl-CoA synthase
MPPVRYYDWAAVQANHRPDAPAIIDVQTDRRLSWRALDERACRLASHLQAHGVAKGDRVAILSPNGPEFFELEFAGGKMGAIMVPLNWRLAVPELEYIIGDCAPKLLIHDKEFAETAAALAERCGVPALLEIDIDDPACAYERALAEASDAPAIEALTHDDLSMIMYTSGTTGRPKGAIITHAMNFYNCVNIGIPSRISPDTVQLVVLPLFHTGGLNCYANPVLHAGGCIIVMREFEPGAALDIMADPDLGMTHFFAVPAHYQFMMQHPKFETADLTRIQMAGVGGAPCAKPILDAWLGRDVPLVQGWGMTETGPTGTLLDVADARRKTGSAGKPVLHVEIRIVDEAGHDVPADANGELVIRGPSITPGYWNNPQASKEAFIDGWLRTGDAARMDADGFIYIVDRWKDMYISGGENVYPAEVESVIYQLPQIAEAAVIGVADERWGEVGKAIVVLKAGETLDADALISHCLANLAKFKVPASVDFIDALPRNATGKVLKWELRERYPEAGKAAAG